MRPLSEHLDAINRLLPALHDGFFVESYIGGEEQLILLGTSDISYHRDLVITCAGPLEVRFEPSFHADSIRLTKNASGQQFLEFIEDGTVVLLSVAAFLVSSVPISNHALTADSHGVR